MELYNFFTEMLPIERKHELESALVQLNSYCHFVELVEWPKNDFSNVSERYSIIGQVYGDDTNLGDMDLAIDLLGIEYTWFDAFNPNINNL